MKKTPPSRKAPAMEAGALFGNNKTCLGLLARRGSLGLLGSGGLACARCGSSLGPPWTDFQDLLEDRVTVAGSGGLGQLALQFGQFLFALITLVQFLATLDHVPAFSKKARDQAPQAPNYPDPLSNINSRRESSGQQGEFTSNRPRIRLWAPARLFAPPWDWRLGRRVFWESGPPEKTTGLLPWHGAWHGPCARDHQQKR